MSFSVESDQAFVASSLIHCRHCAANMEVICIFCESGTAYGDGLSEFTVSSIWGMDESLATQIQAWPQFYLDRQLGQYANHCPACGVAEVDMELHTEPGQPFFSPSQCHEAPIVLRALNGTVRLNGDAAFDS